MRTSQKMDGRGRGLAVGWLAGDAASAGCTRVIDSLSLPRIIACDARMRSMYCAWPRTTICGYCRPMKVANLRTAAENTDYLIKCEQRALRTVGKNTPGFDVMCMRPLGMAAAPKAVTWLRRLNPTENQNFQRFRTPRGASPSSSPFPCEEPHPPLISPTKAPNEHAQSSKSARSPRGPSWMANLRWGIPRFLLKKSTPGQLRTCSEAYHRSHDHRFACRECYESERSGTDKAAVNRQRQCRPILQEKNRTWASSSIPASNTSGGRVHCSVYG